MALLPSALSASAMVSAILEKVWSDFLRGVKFWWKGTKKVSWGSDNHLDDQFLEAPRKWARAESQSGESRVILLSFQNANASRTSWS